MNNWYLLAAIPVFGICVLIHEFGHFITAKWAGIRVEEFGLGFPPRLVGFRRRERGGLEVIWFGGPRDAEDDYGSAVQSPFSGTSGGMRGSAELPVEKHRTIYSLNFLPIGGFVRMPGETGDVRDENGNYDSGSFAAKSAGKRIIVLVAGVIMNILLAMVLFMFAYSVGQPTYPAQIGSVVAGSPAAIAGLKAGDTIVSVDGQKVQQFADVQNIVDNLLSKSGQASTVAVHLLVRHQGQTASFTTTVNARVHPPANQGAMGVVSTNNAVLVKAPFWQAPFLGVSETVSVTGQFVGTLGQLIAGAVKPQISGPVGIVKLTGQVAQTVPTLGWWPILSLTAILNINLAFVNILPFPALDGGRIFLILIELLRGGKRLKPELEGIINLAGMAILLTLMVVVTVSDVIHWNG
jgi:regulator of sigma E protease